MVRDANAGQQLAGGNSSWCPELDSPDHAPGIGVFDHRFACHPDPVAEERLRGGEQQHHAQPGRSRRPDLYAAAVPVILLYSQHTSGCIHSAAAATGQRAGGSDQEAGGGGGGPAPRPGRARRRSRPERSRGSGRTTDSCSPWAQWAAGTATPGCERSPWDMDGGGRSWRQRAAAAAGGGIGGSGRRRRQDGQRERSRKGSERAVRGQ